jgi:hypothetical protein
MTISLEAETEVLTANQNATLPLLALVSLGNTKAESFDACHISYMR